MIYPICPMPLIKISNKLVLGIHVSRRFNLNRHVCTCGSPLAVYQLDCGINANVRSGI